MKMVLALPYERKDEFKQKYGKTLRWNPEDKVWTWVGREGLPEDLKEFLARSYYTPPVSGGPRLTIELVPKTYRGTFRDLDHKGKRSDERK